MVSPLVIVPAYTIPIPDDNSKTWLTPGRYATPLVYNGQLEVAYGGLNGATTDNLPGGVTNLYWTQTLFDTAFAAKSTTNLTEGTNLYFTNARAISAMAGLYEVPLTFSTGLTRTTNTITVNSSQIISKLTNLTTNGFIKTGSGDGTLSVDTSTYITGNQTITLSNDLGGSGATTISATIQPGVVTLAKMANFAANSIMGNNTGSAATPLALTAAQTKTLLSLNNVENTALSTWAGSTNITTLGTVATGAIPFSLITTGSNTSATITFGIGSALAVSTNSTCTWNSPGHLIVNGADGNGIKCLANDKSALTQAVCTSNTATDHAILLAQNSAGAGNAGSAYSKYLCDTNSYAWTAGVNNADSGAYVISRSATLGTNNALRLDPTTGNITTAIWNATKIGLAYGGTNADLSATGAAHSFLKQSSSGAAVTVGTIASTDLPTGSTLQVIQTSKTSVFSTSSSTKTDWTGMTATIVTTTAASKILVMLTSGVSSDNVNAFQFVYLFFNVNAGSYTQIALGDASSSAQRCWVDGSTVGNSSYNVQQKSLTGVFLHTHGQAAGATLIYKLQVAVTNAAGTSYWGRTADVGDANRSSIPSTLTLIEYA